MTFKELMLVKANREVSKFQVKFKHVVRKQFLKDFKTLNNVSLKNTNSNYICIQFIET